MQREWTNRLDTHNENAMMDDNVWYNFLNGSLSIDETKMALKRAKNGKSTCINMHRQLAQ